jgi:hypothetical protein
MYLISCALAVTEPAKKRNSTVRQVGFMSSDDSRMQILSQSGTRKEHIEFMVTVPLLIIDDRAQPERTAQDLRFQTPVVPEEGRPVALSE